MLNFLVALTVGLPLIVAGICEDKPVRLPLDGIPRYFTPAMLKGAGAVVIFVGLMCS